MPTAGGGRQPAASLAVDNNRLAAVKPSNKLASDLEVIGIGGGRQSL